jgi:peptide-methionine (R)-S-oxide reductase
MTTRRMIIRSAIGLGAAGLLNANARTAGAAAFSVEKAESDWRRKLTPAQFAVLRRSGTERPFTSALLDEHRHGIFTCAGCDRDLFSSDTKFDSGTGWPSFWAPLEGAVGQENDGSFGMARTAVHCSRCGGHLGHVFNDGPKPTGLRYCMNGVAMGFKPTAA